MGSLFGLVVVLLAVRQSFSAVPGKTTEAAQVMTTLSLRELLSTYQRLYERQFHEPLPDSQKVLLASLPRFEKPPIPGRISPATALDESRSFQRDDASKKEPKELAVEGSSSTQEPEEPSSTAADFTEEPKVPKESKESSSTATTTTTTTDKTAEKKESSNATTAVSSTSSIAPEKEASVSTSTAPVVTDTTTEQADVVSSTSEPKKKQTDSVKKEIPHKANSTPKDEQPSSTVAPTPVPMNIAENVQLLPSENVKIVPTLAKEAPKMATVAKPSPISDAPVAKLDPESPISSVPVPEQRAKLTAPPTPLETVETSAVREPMPVGAVLRASTPPQPQESVLLQEFSPKIPVKSAGDRAIAMPTRTTRLLTTRTDPDSTRRLVSRQPSTRPVPRAQSRSQPTNLEIMNHVVVPRLPSSGPPQQQARRANGQVRTRQPQRRQQGPARVPLPPIQPAPEGSVSPPPPPPPSRVAQKPINLIVIQDGRVIDLTPQQQRDLSLVLSAMSSSTNETGVRRRAPVRRSLPLANFRGARRPTFN